MVGTQRVHRQAPTGDLEESRLSPATAHDIVRQRLAPLVGRGGLEPIDTHHLARQMRPRTYAPGEILLPRGARADCLGLVVQGQVALHVGEPGSTRLVVVLLPGTTFGEMMLADGRPSNATLQALTACEVWFLRRADYLAQRDERRTERQVSTLWQWVRVSAVLVVVLLALVLAVSLPPSREALALVPMSIGQWCNDRGRDACARQAWQTAANLAPSDPNPNLALGALRFEQGDIAAAEQAFEAARVLAPDSPEAHNNLGLIYARQGKYDRAIAAFQRALELEPGIAATEHNLGRSLQAIGNYEGAVLHYQTALALGEPQTNTLLNMAIAYREMGQLDRMEVMSQEALRLDPELAPAYTLLAAGALESRQPDRALPNLQRAIAVDPGYGPAYVFLGLTYKALDQPAEAIAAFEQALIRADDEVTRVRIRRYLGELYEAQEQSQTP
jgi:tetratricopeptide (TPR) repeat protein